MDFNLKKYQDKGYKLLDKEISKYSKEDLDKILPTDTTDANGMVKPMLAKDFNKVASSALEKKWLASRKIDGVRCLMYYKNGEAIFEGIKGVYIYSKNTYAVQRTEEPFVEIYNNGNITATISKYTLDKNTSFTSNNVFAVRSDRDKKIYMYYFS